MQYRSSKYNKNNTNNAINAEDDLFIFEIVLGYFQQQKFKVPLDTGSFVLWIPSIDSTFKTETKYDKSLSDSYSSLEQTFNVNGLIEGVLSSETISFAKSFSNIEWVLANKYMSPLMENSAGVIGFGRKYTNPYNENQSLLATAQKTEKVFTIEKIDSEQYWLLLDKGEAFKNAANPIGHCNMRTVNASYWECRMSHIMFGPATNETFKGNAISIYREAIFDTGKSVFVFPFEYSDFFVDKLNKYNAECDYKTITTGTKTIYCNKTDKVDDISFVFNGYALKMSNRELFVKNTFLIQFEKTSNVFIGMPFYLLFNTMFDDSGNQMAFLPNDLTQKDLLVNVRKYTTDDDYLFNEHLIIVVIVIIGFIIILGIGVYLFVKLWKMNIMDEYKYITQLEAQANNNIILYEE